MSHFYIIAAASLKFTDFPSTNQILLIKIIFYFHIILFSFIFQI